MWRRVGCWWQPPASRRSLIDTGIDRRTAVLAGGARGDDRRRGVRGGSAGGTRRGPAPRTGSMPRTSPRPSSGRCTSPPLVAAKSIAAYRIGLDLPADPPSTETPSLLRSRSLRPAANGRYRIADPVINAWLAWTAIKTGAAAAGPRRVRRRRHRPAPRRSATADPVPARDRGARSSGAAAAQLPVPPPRRVPGAGLRPRLHRCRTWPCTTPARSVGH